MSVCAHFVSKCNFDVGGDVSLSACPPPTPSEQLWMEQWRAGGSFISGEQNIYLCTG